MNQSQSKNIPAGLLILADAVERMPDQAGRILEREHESKKVALLSVASLKRVYSWNLGRTVMIALLIGVSVGSALWSVSSIVGLFGSAGMSFAGTASELSQLGIGGLSNPSVKTTLTLAESLPKFGAGDIFMYSVLSMFLYGVIKFLLVLPNIERLKMLKEESVRLEEEIGYLNGWMSDLAGRSAKK